MHILVVLHPIRDPAAFTVNRKAQKIFQRSGREPHMLNPADKNALETALQLNGNVTAVALGEAPAEDVLRWARALGADRAIQVTGVAHFDASVETTILQRVMAQIGKVDLVLLGAEVLGADLAQVGPRLAEVMGYSFFSDALQVSIVDKTVQVVVERWGGAQRGEADLPTVIAIPRDSNQPRYAHGSAIIHFYQAPDAVETLTPATLGLTDADLTPLVEMRGESFPPERELGRKLDGDVPDLARQVLEMIRKI
jgi:electron transfer flavoprotein beta subunit